MKKQIIFCLLAVLFIGKVNARNQELKPRVLVMTDAEVDDQCSMVRFLLYADVLDIEGIITTSSQYHSHGHNWSGDNWMDPYLEAYTEVYLNLKKNDTAYPTPEYLKARTILGNVSKEGDMTESTPGSKFIVNLLLSENDNRPIWFLAWGGINTLSRALKTIQEKYPDKMADVAKKMRFYFMWEQDSTYQSYIRPNWGKYNILTIISDQSIGMAYFWKNILPGAEQKYYEGSWMKPHILQNHGSLCALYQAQENGDFQSEGDSPSFMYTIINGLSNGSLEHPDWGSWGGRYVKVRENTWLDSVPEPGYKYPKGRWYTGSAWGRQRIRKGHGDFESGKDTTPDKELLEYLKPVWRWVPEVQNDFAARADWCVKPYPECNHPPVVILKNDLKITAKPGSKIRLSAKGTYDPDGNSLVYNWWQYKEAETYKGNIDISNANKKNASFTIPEDAGKGKTIHVICEVKDNGIPQLTRYQRIVVQIE